jgi:hypothetical protein
MISLRVERIARPIRINRIPWRKGRKSPRNPKMMKNQPMITNPSFLIEFNGYLSSKPKRVKPCIIIKNIQPLPLFKKVYHPIG